MHLNTGHYEFHNLPDRAANCNYRRKPDPVAGDPHDGQDDARGVEFDDPLDEGKDSPMLGRTHRYPNRVLMVAT